MSRKNVQKVGELWLIENNRWFLNFSFLFTKTLINIINKLRKLFKYYTSILISTVFTKKLI